MVASNGDSWEERMLEAHVVGRGFPSCGPVAILSLTARRKLSGGSGSWGLEAGDVSQLVTGKYCLGSHQVGGMFTSGNELLQASPLRAAPRTRGMGEPRAQAGQPAIEGHQDAQYGSGNSKRCAGAKLHICASCRRVYLLGAASNCEDLHFCMMIDRQLWGPCVQVQDVERVLYLAEAYFTHVDMPSGPVSNLHQ